MEPNRGNKYIKKTYIYVIILTTLVSKSTMMLWVCHN